MTELLRFSSVSPSTVVTALQTVGRAPLGAFQRFDRPATSSPVLDELETAWWNQYGQLIEKVWSLPDQLCWSLRQNYLNQARQFFLQGNPAGKILEIGCGSGWLGRLLANSSLQVIGIDGSATQIELAKRQAAAQQNAHCHYYCVSSLDEVPDLETVNGVIMHAFLHHLYWDELAGLFSALQQALPAHTRIFLLEPVYIDAPTAVTPEQQQQIQQRRSDLEAALTGLRATLVEQGQFDLATESMLQATIAESERGGYFLSPKEVPFAVEELQQFLQLYTQIQSTTVASVFDLDVAQMLAYVPDSTLRQTWAEQLLPLSQSFDRFLIEQNCLAYPVIGRYVFMAYECLLRPKSVTGDPAMLHQAVQFLNAKEHQKALDYLTPERDPSAFYPKAIALARLGRVDEAIATLQQQLSQSPRYAKARQLLAELLALQAQSGVTVAQLAALATAPATWKDILDFHGLLATDEYVQEQDQYYRDCLSRLGPDWYYLDIVNILYAAARALRPRNYLEIGVRRGRSACTVARGCPEVNIYAFDMWMADYAGMENPGPEYVRSQLQLHNHQGQVTFIDGDSHQTLPQFFADNPDLVLDLITVDGDHSEDGALADLCDVIPHLAVGGVLVFDDIAHPEHPYLLDVWRRAMAKFPELSAFEFAETGYGIGFAVRRAA